MQLLPLLPGGRVTPPQCGALRQQCPPLLLHAAPILTGRMHARTNTHMHTHMLLPHQPEACVYRRCIGPCVQKFPCPVYHVRYVHKYICVHARKLCAHGWYTMYAMQIFTHVCMQGKYVRMAGTPCTLCKYVRMCACKEIMCAWLVHHVRYANMYTCVHARKLCAHGSGQP